MRPILHNLLSQLNNARYSFSFCLTKGIRRKWKLVKGVCLFMVHSQYHRSTSQKAWDELKKFCLKMNWTQSVAVSWLPVISPDGTCRRKTKASFLANMRQGQTCVCCIQNHDNSCVSRVHFISVSHSRSCFYFSGGYSVAFSSSFTTHIGTV